MNAQIHPLDRLRRTVKTLRSPAGCPWDRKQTVTSLKKHLQEECDEIIAAIDKNDPENLCEELGDFLYLIVMLAEISRDQQQFALEDVIDSIDEKLIRRHPHVFEKYADLDESELKTQWERIKQHEKANKSS